MALDNNTNVVTVSGLSQVVGGIKDWVERYRVDGDTWEAMIASGLGPDSGNYVLEAAYVYPELEMIKEEINSANSATSADMEVIAAALTDLDSRVVSLSGDLDSIKPTASDVILDVGSASAAGVSDHYARADHVHKISVGTGSTSGTVKIAGQDAKVAGWDSLVASATEGSVKSIKIEGYSQELIKADKTVEIPTVTSSHNGVMTSADYDKLQNIEASAQVNAIESITFDGVTLPINPDKSVDLFTSAVDFDSFASSAVPTRDGAGSAGSSVLYARGDHQHPTDTSREAAANKATDFTVVDNVKFPTTSAVKAYVDEHIATETAEYLGLVDISALSLPTSATDAQIATALNAYWPSQTPPVNPSNNDYCIVTVNDEDQPQPSENIEHYKKFKYDAKAASPTWKFEYEIYNPGFTNAQWSALNSTIDLTKVQKYEELDSYVRSTSGLYTDLYGNQLTQNDPGFLTNSAAYDKFTQIESEIQNMSGNYVESVWYDSATKSLKVKDGNTTSAAFTSATLYGDLSAAISPTANGFARASDVYSRTTWTDHGTSGSSDYQYVKTIHQNQDGTVSATLGTIPDASSTVKGLMSASDYAKLATIQTSAEVNQNAFSSIILDGTGVTVSADSKMDEIILATSGNLVLTASTVDGRDKITIGLPTMTSGDVQDILALLN